MRESKTGITGKMNEISDRISDRLGERVNDGRDDAINSSESYGEILKEIASSSKALIQSEAALVTAELKQSAKNAGQHMTQVLIFGVLLALSVFPFLAFLVIGLGDLLEGRYWLSSLIVAVVCASVGGIFAYRAYKKILNDDLDFSRTKRTLGREIPQVQASVADVKDAVKGEFHGATQFN